MSYKTHFTVAFLGWKLEMTSIFQWKSHPSHRKSRAHIHEAPSLQSVQQRPPKQTCDCAVGSRVRSSFPFERSSHHTQLQPKNRVRLWDFACITVHKNSNQLIHSQVADRVGTKEFVTICGALPHRNQIIAAAQERVRSSLMS